jgi:predicted acylesterase/phospholipase RssA
MKTGVFLTPGASRTAYQVGALHELATREEVSFDVIAASSVGTLNGTFAAMHQTDTLVEIWSNWETSDVMEMKPGALLKDGIFWAPSLASNEPEHETAIEPFIEEEKLDRAIRFRFNLANLTTGQDQVFEFPDHSRMPLPQAVGASVAVPVMFEPVTFEDEQYADGLTIDGCPLEKLLLSTGVDRAFVIGVAPRKPGETACENVYEAGMRVADWNQYSETLRAIDAGKAVNDLIRSWQGERSDLKETIREVVPEGDRRDALLETVDRIYAESEFPHDREPVEIIPILPAESIDIWIGDFDPERSRELIARGREDARAILRERSYDGADRS